MVQPLLQQMTALTLSQKGQGTNYELLLYDLLGIAVEVGQGQLVDQVAGALLELAALEQEPGGRDGIREGIIWRAGKLKVPGPLVALFGQMETDRVRIRSLGAVVEVLANQDDLSGLEAFMANQPHPALSREARVLAIDHLYRTGKPEAARALMAELDPDAPAWNWSVGEVYPVAKAEHQPWPEAQMTAEFIEGRTKGLLLPEQSNPWIGDSAIAATPFHRGLSFAVEHEVAAGRYDQARTLVADLPEAKVQQERIGVELAILLHQAASDDPQPAVQAFRRLPLDNPTSQALALIRLGNALARGGHTEGLMEMQARFGQLPDQPENWLAEISLSEAERSARWKQTRSAVALALATAQAVLAGDLEADVRPYLAELTTFFDKGGQHTRSIEKGRRFRNLTEWDALLPEDDRLARTPERLVELLVLSGDTRTAATFVADSYDSKWDRNNTALAALQRCWEAGAYRQVERFLSTSYSVQKGDGRDNAAAITHGLVLNRLWGSLTFDYENQRW